MGRFLIYFFFLGAFLSCVSGKKASTYDYKKVAEEKLGSTIMYTFNSDSTYILAISEKHGSAKQPQNNIKFVVFDLQNETIVYEDGIDNGTVGFHSDRELKILQIPGVMPQNMSLDDHTFIYDLKTKEKRPFSL